MGWRWDGPVPRTSPPAPRRSTTGGFGSISPTVAHARRSITLVASRSMTTPVGRREFCVQLPGPGKKWSHLASLRRMPPPPPTRPKPAVPAASPVPETVASFEGHRAGGSEQGLTVGPGADNRPPVGVIVRPHHLPCTHRSGVPKTLHILRPLPSAVEFIKLFH